MTDHPRDIDGDEAEAPHPEDERKPDSPTDLTRPSWKYVLRTTLREFSADGCSDLAAALTYRSLLALFPGLIALVSILSLFGQSGSVTSVLEEARSIVPADTWDSVGPGLESVLTAPGPGLGLVLGLVTALWATSGEGHHRQRQARREVLRGRGAGTQPAPDRRPEPGGRVRRLLTRVSGVTTLRRCLKGDGVVDPLRGGTAVRAGPRGRVRPRSAARAA